MGGAAGKAEDRREMGVSILWLPSSSYLRSRVLLNTLHPHRQSQTQSGFFLPVCWGDVTTGGMRLGGRMLLCACNLGSPQREPWAPNAVSLNTYIDGDGLRGGVIERRPGQEGGAPIDGISALQKETPSGPLVSVV